MKKTMRNDACCSRLVSRTPLATDRHGVTLEKEPVVVGVLWGLVLLSCKRLLKAVWRGQQAR